MMTTAPQRTETERWREEFLLAASDDVWAWLGMPCHNKLLRTSRLSSQPPMIEGPRQNPSRLSKPLFAP
jgi:hypothetical protein